MLTVKNIRKSFGEHQVLKGINLTVGDGEVVSLIGPSGTGKSTLMRAINFLEPADTGVVTLGNITLQAKKYTSKQLLEFRRSTAMVFQQYNLFRHLKVIDNIIQPQILVRKVSKEQARRNALELLERVGLVDFANYYPIQLSGGQQQRVSIARALALSPKLILFDEPTSALDPELSQEVLKVIKSVADSGIMTILATHEMQFAEEISDRVVFMEDGKIVEEGKPKQIFHYPQEQRTAQFLQNYGTQLSSNYRVKLQIAK
ncbi:MAG: amino acid ABC transporter ATP-binding protein [Lactobacillus sp.]|nr:amino acid ABC transporter ATP-binding protein [Lactobacillus sp.]